MDDEPSCVIKKLDGVSSEFRHIAFVRMQQDNRINAGTEFIKLRQKDERTLRTRFDYWLNGKVCDRYFHGWNKNEFEGRYVNCFVFKLNEVRFYGYLCHPDPANRRFQVCLLVLCAFKNQWRTDAWNLKFVKAIGEHPAVKKMLTQCFNTR